MAEQFLSNEAIARDIGALIARAESAEADLTSARAEVERLRGVGLRAINLLDLLLNRYERDPFDNERRWRTGYVVTDVIETHQRVSSDLRALLDGAGVPEAHTDQEA